MRTSSLLALCLAGLLSACSTTFEPKVSVVPVDGFDLVDPTKVDKDKYEQDYAQCVSLANQDFVSAQRMASGAIGVAADKATFGLIGGKPGKNADRFTVLKRCLEGRGYHILR